MNYYNEWNPYAADWLRNLIDAGLIPPGYVDERSICDVQPEDLEGYTQCHFFCGIAGWCEALRLAAWPTDVPVWTGSCPCQSYSTAGKQLGMSDDRDLWPAFNNLIQKCRPPVVFGEQVASAIRFGWLDRVYANLEAAGYACGAAVLGAHSVGSPHIRQRLYWVARLAKARPYGEWMPVVWSADCDEFGDCPHCGIDYAECECIGPTEDDVEYDERDGVLCGRRLGHSPSNGQQPGRLSTATTRHTVANGCTSRLGHTEQPGLEGHSGHVDDGDQPGRLDQNTPRSITTASCWGDYESRACGDGKTRRLKSGLEPLVNGIPFRLADGRTGTAEASRAEILKGIGNAIVPHVAAEFVVTSRGE